MRKRQPNDCAGNSGRPESVVGSITPWGPGPLATQIDPNYGFKGADIDTFNYGLLFYLDPDYFTNVGVADYHGALAVPGNNGYDGIDRGDGTEYQRRGRSIAAAAA